MIASSARVGVTPQLSLNLKEGFFKVSVPEHDNALPERQPPQVSQLSALRISGSPDLRLSGSPDLNCSQLSPAALK